MSDSEELTPIPGGRDPARFQMAPEALRVARACALKLGLCADAAEDCALSFVGDVLLDAEERLLRPRDLLCRTGQYSERWLWRCALNHARNFRRRLDRTQSRETLWPGVGDDWVDASVSVTGNPEAALLRREVWDAVQDSLDLLDPTPRLLLLQHLAGQTTGQLASSLGRTPHAVDQARMRARLRLKGLLERQGLTGEDILLHLAAAPEGATPGPRKKSKNNP